jgi:hypothetical protein
VNEQFIKVIKVFFESFLKSCFVIFKKILKLEDYAQFTIKN